MTFSDDKELCGLVQSNKDRVDEHERRLHNVEVRYGVQETRLTSVDKKVDKAVRILEEWHVHLDRIHSAEHEIQVLQRDQERKEKEQDQKREDEKERRKAQATTNEEFKTAINKMLSWREIVIVGIVMLLIGFTGQIAILRFVPILSGGP